MFYLLSFLARDMLWLRVLTCLGLVLGISYFALQPTPLYSCIAWQFAFLLINFVQIRGLVLERRQLQLSCEQERLGYAAFQDRSREQLVALLSRTICAAGVPQCDLSLNCGEPLTDEERALREIAFSRLSRKELLNLLTRRLWRSLKRRKTAWWPRRGGDASSPELTKGAAG